MKEVWKILSYTKVCLQELSEPLKLVHFRSIEERTWVCRKEHSFQHTPGKAEDKLQWQAAELPVGSKFTLLAQGPRGTELWGMETFLWHSPQYLGAGYQNAISTFNDAGLTFSIYIPAYCLSFVYLYAFAIYWFDQRDSTVEQTGQR